MEFYQVAFGLENYEESWEKRSHLFKELENAEAFTRKLGFEKKVEQNSDDWWKQTFSEGGNFADDDIPGWAIITKVWVLD